MNIRERLEAFWTNQAPDQIPYAIYYNEWRHTQNDPAWLPLFEAGLGVTWHAHVVKKQPDSTVEIIETDYEENGKPCRRQTIRTPVGEVYALWEDGWQTRYHLNEPEDYRVLAYAVEHTAISPDFAPIRQLLDSGPAWTVPLIFVGRTPFQTIHVDYAGLENISMHLFECPDEIGLLYQALRRRFTTSSSSPLASPRRTTAALPSKYPSTSPRTRRTPPPSFCAPSAKPVANPKFGIRVRAKGAKRAKKKTEWWFDLPWRPSRPWRESFFSVRRFSRTVGKSFLLGEGVTKRDRKENLSRRHKDTEMRSSAVLPLGSPWLREKKSSQNCANMRDSSARRAKKRTHDVWSSHLEGECFRLFKFPPFLFFACLASFAKGWSLADSWMPKASKAAAAGGVASLNHRLL